MIVHKTVLYQSLPGGLCWGDWIFGNRWASGSRAGQDAAPMHLPPPLTMNHMYICNSHRLRYHFRCRPLDVILSTT